MRSLFILLAVLSITQSWKKSDQYHIKDGEYIGKGFLHVVFAKIENDSVFVNWVYMQKEPRDFVSDTIIVTNTFPYVGKFSSLYKEKSKVYIETLHPWHSEIKIKAELKPDPKFYRNIDSFKNTAYLHKEELKIKSKYLSKTELEMYDMLLKEYSLYEKVSKLNHQDFVEEFLKFKVELNKKF